MIWLDVMIIVIIIVVSAFSLSIGPRVQQQGYTHSLAGCLTPDSYVWLLSVPHHHQESESDHIFNKHSHPEIWRLANSNKSHVRLTYRHTIFIHKPATVKPDIIPCVLQVSVAVVTLLSFVLVSKVEGSFLENLSELAPKENYDAFFNMVDRFLWDSEDAEERQFRRGS